MPLPDDLDAVLYLGRAYLEKAALLEEAEDYLVRGLHDRDRLAAFRTR